MKGKRRINEAGEDMRRARSVGERVVPQPITVIGSSGYIDKSEMHIITIMRKSRPIS